MKYVIATIVAATLAALAVPASATPAPATNERIVCQQIGQFTYCTVYPY